MLQEAPFRKWRSWRKWRIWQNSPWVWQIGWHSGLLESGDYDENGEYGEKSPEGWRKFSWDYKRRSLQRTKVDKDGESYKNGKFGENRKFGKSLPWVWQIFKLDTKSDPWRVAILTQMANMAKIRKSPNLSQIRWQRGPLESSKFDAGIVWL